MNEKPSKWKVFTAGIIRENPVLRLVLGCCSALAVTTTVSGAVGMGLAMTFVLVCSNIVISALRKVIPAKVHLPCYIVIIATFVTVVQMVLQAFVPDLYKALGVYLALIVFVSVSGYMNPPTGDERVIIVLGAGLHKDKPSKLLQCRLNKAYDYAAAHPDTLVITSGGQGRDEWLPEGDAMRDYLIAKGLPADRVLAESGSTSTEENFAFSLTILREHGFDETTPIVYVSNAFHCYRAGKYAALAGFTKATALPAATPWRSVLPCYLREALALLYYWVFKTSASGPMHAMVGLLELNKNFFYK